MSYSIFLPMLFLLFWTRRNRHELAVAWQYRRIFPAHIYWGIALLYVLSGASFTFIVFGAQRFEMPISSAPMQIFAVVSLLSMGVVYVFARKRATPIFNANEIPQRDRNYVQGLWGMFWLPGLAIGLLPTLIPTVH